MTFISSKSGSLSGLTIDPDTDSDFDFDGQDATGCFRRTRFLESCSRRTPNGGLVNETGLCCKERYVAKRDGSRETQAFAGWAGRSRNIISKV